MDDYIAEKIESALWSINETLQVIAATLLDGGRTVALGKLNQSYERLREHKEYIISLKQEKEGSLV